MIIIDKPYISEELKAYLDDSQVPVLESEIARVENQGHRFNLMDEKTFAQRYKEGARLYTLSENSLDWIKKNIEDDTLIHAIEVMKDKYLFRQKIQELYPDFYFQKVKMKELGELEINPERFPLVLKPVVGFFSAGVYVLNNEEDLEKSIMDLKETYGRWKNIFPSTVVGEDEFILEQYIVGNEYAVDAYYDEEGCSVVLNVLAHEFSSQSDVSDTLYYTSKEILEKYVPTIETYLNQVNNILGIKNFPFHMEVRVTEDGVIIPIEFNPLRFAGWCTTEITRFAFGFFTYDYYFRGVRPDWKQLLEGKDNMKYPLILLKKPVDLSDNVRFDYEKLKQDFTKVLCLRTLDYSRQENPFGFLFVETPYECQEELTRIMKSDLSEYIQDRNAETPL